MEKVIYMEGLAEKLGKTKEAVRALFYRGRTDCLPKHFYLGRRPAWLEKDVDRWLRERARSS